MKPVCLISLLVALTYIECAHFNAKYVIYDLKKAPELFAKFRHDFGKHYCSQKETKRRFEIFKNNLKEINKINSQHLSWWAGINQFADMTHEEVEKCCMGFHPPKNTKNVLLNPRTRTVISDSSVDDSSAST